MPDEDDLTLAEGGPEKRQAEANPRHQVHGPKKGHAQEGGKGETRPARMTVWGLWQWAVAGAVLLPTVVVALVTFVAALLTLMAIWKEWNQVFIDPVHVPEAAVKAGWTGEVIARQIMDEIRKIDRAGHTDYPHPAYDQPTLNEPDFIFPGSGRSLRALAAWLHPPKRLIADVVELNEQDLGKACGDRTIESSKEYQIHARLDGMDSSWVRCRVTLGELIQITAEEAVRQTNPYRLGLYFASKNDFKRAGEIADEMLGTDSAEHVWALNLLGLLHVWYGRDFRRAEEKEEANIEFTSAISELERAYRIRPDFPNAYINHGEILLYDLGQYDAAIDKFNLSIGASKSLGRTPYISSYIGLGFAQLALHQLDEAVKNFDTALKINGNYIDRRDNTDDAYVGLAKAWEAKNDPVTAASFLAARKCLERGRQIDVCK